MAFVDEPKEVDIKKPPLSRRQIRQS